MRPGRACLSVALLALCLAGCTPEEEAADRAVVISLPQWFYPSPERPWMEGVWETLRREHPGVTLDLRLSPGRTEQVLQKLLVARAAGEGPDLACIRLHWAGELGRHGLLEPLDGVVPDRLWGEMVPSLAAAAGREGAHRVLPYDVGVRVILYREDLFREAGIPEPGLEWTREDLVRAARALTVDRDGDGNADRWGLGLPGARDEKTVFQWLPWFWSLGGSFGDPGGDGPPALGTPASAAALQWVRDLVWQEKVTPPTVYSMDQSAVFQGLAGGLFAMTEGGSWEPVLLKEYSRHPHRVRMALLPSMVPGKPSVSLVDGWGFALFTRDAQKRRVIGDVLAALSSDAHQWEKFEAARMLSPLRALYRDPRFLSDPSGRVLAAAVQGGRPLPDFPSFSRVQEALEICLQQVLMDNADPAGALEAGQAALQAAARSGREAPGPASGKDRARGPRAGESPVPPGLPPPGSLWAVFQDQGRERLLAPADLLALERAPVGDRRLVPLAALFPGAPAADVLVRAADGYEKRIPAAGLATAFLDPEALTVVLAREGERRAFTVRDVVRVIREEGPADRDALVIAAGEARRSLSAERLRALAGGGGSLAFEALRAEGLPELPDSGSVRLVARDGYARDVPAPAFLGGRLHLEGMRCDFPGLPSRDQVRDLARVEIR